TRSGCVRSGTTAGPASTRPSRTSKDAPCSGHTIRVARRRPSHMRACACVQILSSAKMPSRVWQTTNSPPAMLHAWILPTRTSASFITGSNCAPVMNGVLQGHVGFEDGHGLADDPDAIHTAVLELQLDFHMAGPVHVVALGASE